MKITDLIKREPEFFEKIFPYQTVDKWKLGVKPNLNSIDKIYLAGYINDRELLAMVNDLVRGCTDPRTIAKYEEFKKERLKKS